MTEPFDIPDEPLAPTTAQDLQDALSCWSRIEILLALAGPVQDVTALAKSLGVSKSLLSNHLKILRRVKLVRYERSGLQHMYALTPLVRASVDSSIVLSVTADDGSALSWNVPLDSSVARLLARGLFRAHTNGPDRSRLPASG